MPLPAITRYHRLLWGGSLLLIATLLLLGQFDHDLWSPDEPREAGIAWEMLRSHDFIVPTLSGSYFIEKPPLFYWSVIAVNALTGSMIDPIHVLRLTCSLYAAGTLLCLWLAARALYDARTACWSLLALATMSGFLEHFHIIRTDVALAFFCAMSLWTLIAFYYTQRRQFALWTAVAISGAFLAKGPVAPLVMIPFWGALFLYQIALQGREHWRRLLVDNLLLILAIVLLCGSWCWALMTHQDGEWLWNEWFWRNQVGRLTGTAGLGHDEATTKFDYIPSLITLTLAWIPLIAGWLWTTLRAGRQMDIRHLLLLVGAILSFTMLSMAQTKRALYLLPILPFFAMMAGHQVAFFAHQRWIQAYALFALWAALLFQFAVLLLPLYGDWLPTRHATTEILTLIGHHRSGQITAVALSIGLIIAMRVPALGALRIVVAVSCIFATWTSFMQTIQSERKSTRAENTALYQAVPIGRHDHTLGVGLSEVELGALSFYHAWTPGNIDEAEIKERITRQRPFGLLVHGASTYQRLRPQLLPWIQQEYKGYSRQEHNDDTTLTWVWLAFPASDPLQH